MLDLVETVDANFALACRMILDCRGRVVVSGMGKSGHVARKIAATLASTGTPAFFVHPAEASHGDLGMITRDDVFIALSNSGETDELLTIVPLVKRQGARLHRAHRQCGVGALARHADIHLYAGARARGVPAQPGAHRQHDRRAGARRRAGGGPAGCAGLRQRRLRPLASGRHPRAPAAHAGLRRDAHRRGGAAGSAGQRLRRPRCWRSPASAWAWSPSCEPDGRSRHLHRRRPAPGARAEPGRSTWPA